MRNILIAILFIAPRIVFSQSGSAKEAESKLIQAINKKGAVIKKTSQPLGVFKELGYFHITVEDILAASKTKGLHIVGGVGFVHLVNHAYVDSDELKALLVVLERIRDERSNTNSKINYMFSSKGDSI